MELVGIAVFMAADLPRAANFTTGFHGFAIFRNLHHCRVDGGWFLTNGTIQLNGVASAGSFTVYEQGGGVVVTLCLEPTTVLLACAGFGTVLFFRRRIRA